jgi:hypothetical protein
MVTSYTDVTQGTAAQCDSKRKKHHMETASVGGRFASWNCGFEWCGGHGCVSAVSCQVTGRSLVQRSPTDCVSVVECGQVRQQPSAPTVGGVNEVRIGERERENEFRI